MDSSLQSRIHLWRQRNFPDADAEQQFMGLVEEVGELAHALLKRKQGIRGTPEEHRKAILDAVGDIQIFLAGFCSYEDINMEYQYAYTAREVMERDWIAYPLSGYPPGKHLDDEAVGLAPPLEAGEMPDPYLP